MITAGTAEYGSRRFTAAELLKLRSTPGKVSCRWQLGCGGLATGWSRDRVTAYLVEACETHKGRW